VPATYRIDRERRIILSTASGVLTDHDIREHQQQLRSDPDFDASFDQLWDHRDVTDFQITTATLRDLATARSFKPGSRRAVVTPSDLGFGLARMFQTLHEEAPEDLRVFRTIEEARSWLGLD